MSEATKPPYSFRFHGRSFLAMVLKPEVPVASWLAEADKWIERSPGFFSGKPVVIDISGLSLTKRDFDALMSGLMIRDIKILGVEGADPAWLGNGLPPLLTRATPGARSEDTKPADASPPFRGGPGTFVNAHRRARALSVSRSYFHRETSRWSGRWPPALKSSQAARSMSTGPLRGRAIAGFNENPDARIFCHRLEAELLAINGYYSTAEELEPKLRERSVQAWLEHDAVKLAVLA